MSLYLDASFLVALLTEESLSSRAEAFVGTVSALLIVSDFAAAEFASSIARRVRNRETQVNEARIILAGFDAWCSSRSQPAEISPVDIAVATASVRRLDLPLRTPDAIHLAIAQRLGASLVTFDRTMARAARTLGIAVADA